MAGKRAAKRELRMQGEVLAGDCVVCSANGVQIQSNSARLLSRESQ